MADGTALVVERNFDASCALVWRAWTDPDLIARWYGPNVETIVHEFDLRPGGAWLNEMKMRGMSDYSKMVFQEIVPESLLIWHHHSTDSDWNIIANPMMPDWPKTLLTTVAFTAQKDGTLVVLRQSPLNATAAEVACFARMVAGMSGGWGSGLAIMDEILADLAP